MTDINSIRPQSDLGSTRPPQGELTQVTIPPADARPGHLATRTAFDEAWFRVTGPSFDVDGAAARIVAAYDRDGNGVIDLTPSAIGSETTRFDGGAVSIASLAHEADRLGNGDGTATVQEIADVIAGFDGCEGLLGARIGADGRLDPVERLRFLERFGEVPAIWSSTASVIPRVT